MAYGRCQGICFISLTEDSCFGLLGLGKVFWASFQGEMKNGEALVNEGFVDMSYMGMMSCWQRLETVRKTELGFCILKAFW